MGGRRGRGDTQCAVAARGAQLQRQFRVRAPHRGVEQLALLVADVDQKRLLIREPVDGVEHAADVALAGIGQDVLNQGGFSTVAHLPGGRDVLQETRPFARTTIGTVEHAASAS